jgi:hypothetical protein
MEVLDFRYFNTDDYTDPLFIYGKAWSRLYEYPAVVDCIDKYCSTDKPLLHNTSWGFEGVHIVFKEYLEKRYGSGVVNSDINPSKEPNTFTYNICKLPLFDMYNKYDVVLNISTVEEVKGFRHIDVFENLYSQVKNGGLLIFTFDYPGLQLESFEEYFGLKIEDKGERLNGSNSALPNIRYSHLNCGLVCIRKTEK